VSPFRSRALTLTSIPCQFSVISPKFDESCEYTSSWPTIVMEHVEGDTLTDVMHRTKLSIEDVIRYGTQIADALAAAPARGVVHRDLKAGNIMVTLRRQGARLRIGDTLPFSDC
jgi:serine/threonine protein kinase